MNKKLKIIKIVIIILIAALLTKLVTDYLKGFDDTVMVVVAKENIPERTVIEENMLEIVPIGFKEKARFFIDGTESKKELIGQIAYKAIDRQYVFRKSDTHLVASQEGLTLKNNKINDPFFIGTDERLIQVGFSNTNGLATVIKKGDYADVTYTSKDDSTGGVYAAVILQHVFLYDVMVNGDKIDVLFKTTPEQCLALTLGRETGVLGLLLNPLEGQTKAIAPVTPSLFFKGHEKNEETK